MMVCFNTRYGNEKKFNEIVLIAELNDNLTYSFMRCNNSLL